MSTNDLCRMVKRRLVAAGLRLRLSQHSFRVTTITSSEESLTGLPTVMEHVAELRGFADPESVNA